MVLVVLAASAVAAPGDLDRSFSRNGTATLALSARDDAATAVIAARDGGILIAAHADPAHGYNADFVVVRYRRDGTLDPGFGQRGVARVDFQGGWDAANALVEQPDGKIVVVGYATWFTAARKEREGVGVARLLPDGRRDPSFGADGTVVLPGSAFRGAPDTLGAGAVAVGRDGRIVLAGDVGCGGECGDDIGILAARLLPDGRLDANFAHGGTLVRYDACCIGGIIVRRDSSLLIGGQTGDPEFCTGGKMLLLRLTCDGRPDRRWADHGRLLIGFPHARGAAAWAMQAAPGHRVILAGYAYKRDLGASYVAVARVHVDGRLDRSFSRDGRARTHFDARTSDSATGVAVGRHGTVALSVQSCLAFVTCRFGVARFRRDGRIDTSFSADGRRLIMFGSTRADASDVTVDRRNRTVAVGFVYHRRTHDDVAVVRLH
jgi:uncharacterized delta-60 repeat protein